MGAEHWHKNAPFRRKLIDNEAGSRSTTRSSARSTPAISPSTCRAATAMRPARHQDFRDAIDAELRGKKALSIDERSTPPKRAGALPKPEEPASRRKRRRA
jgi:hypothetical protein